MVLGFGLGMVHAFDADHVVALSIFSARGRGMRDGIRAGLRWSLGHGLVLLVAGIALLWLGRTLPDAWAVAAERAVGGLMVALGVWVFVELARQRGHLHFHAHDDLPPHAHWHAHDQGTPHRSTSHRHDHAPVFVGALHGLAGSAPILAVLPASTRSPAIGVAYLLLFALGVGLAMAIVSGAVGHVAGRAGAARQARRLISLRALGAVGSIALGVSMLTMG